MRTGRVHAAAVVLAAAAGVLPAQERAPARLGLLVGIDEYQQPDVGSVPKLRGAVNDLGRVRALLGSRFGFRDEDLVVLTGPEATHERIVRTFHDHLIRRAGPDTRVVFWFSGHGSRIPDSSGAERSMPPEGEGPHDSTLVAYDSRAGDRDGSFDLADDELASLLAALSARDVLVVTDCCHSAGVTRGTPPSGTRTTSLGHRPLDRAAVDRFWPAAVPWIEDDQAIPPVRHVHVAACGEDQEAGEVPIGDRWYGTLTWFLCGVLDEVPASTSWTAVGELTLARVAGQGTHGSQIVSCDGPCGRAVFGGTGTPVPPGFAVRVDGARLWIGAGRIHGVGDGTRLRVCTLDGREVGVAVAEVVRSADGSASVSWNAEAPAAGTPLRAVPERLSAQARLRIALAAGVDPACLPACAWVEPVAGDAEYELVGDGRGLLLRDAHGVALRRMAAAGGDVAQALFAEYAFRSLWEAVARPGALPLQVAVAAGPAERAAAVGLAVPLVQAVAAGRRATVRAPPYRAGSGGALVVFEVANASTVDLHLAVLSVCENRVVELVHGRSRENVVRAGQTVTVEAQVGPAPDWPADRPMVDRYLFFATPRYADFLPFSTLAPPDRRERTAPSLADTLGDAVRGEAPGPWGMAWLDLELRPVAGQRR